MKSASIALFFLLISFPALAQGWGNLDGLLFRHLTNSGQAEASFWLPDAATPSAANRAIGVVYEHIPGSAGNTGIAVGLFAKQAGNWIFVGHIEGLWGHQPRNAVFGPNSADIITTTLGPNEPRCCPTQVSRWRIDLRTRTTRPLN